MVRRVITDDIWKALECTLRQKGCHRWKNDRNIMEAIIWKLRTGVTPHKLEYFKVLQLMGGLQ